MTKPCYAGYTTSGRCTSGSGCWLPNTARLTHLLLLSPEERYRSLLASGKTKILERIPQHLVANYLGVTPVSLSRIRGRVARPRMRPS